MSAISGPATNLLNRDRDFIMLHFALSECGRALAALRTIDDATVPKPHPLHSGGQIYEIQPVFNAIRFALQLSANVSRMLWPPRNLARGEHLRSLAGIPADHPLRDRRLRNHIEHIDERLDDWLAHSPRPFMAVEISIPASMPQVDGSIDLAAFAAIVYDARTATIRLFGDTFSLTELAQSLVDLGNRLSAKVRLMEDLHRDEQIAHEEGQGT